MDFFTLASLGVITILSAIQLTALLMVYDKDHWLPSELTPGLLVTSGATLMVSLAPLLVEVFG